MPLRVFNLVRENIVSIQRNFRVFSTKGKICIPYQPAEARQTMVTPDDATKKDIVQL